SAVRSSGLLPGAGPARGGPAPGREDAGDLGRGGGRGGKETHRGPAHPAEGTAQGPSREGPRAPASSLRSRPAWRMTGQGVLDEGNSDGVPGDPPRLQGREVRNHDARARGTGAGDDLDGRLACHGGRRPADRMDAGATQEGTATGGPG